MVQAVDIKGLYLKAAGHYTDKAHGTRTMRRAYQAVIDKLFRMGCSGQGMIQAKTTEARTYKAILRQGDDLLKRSAQFTLTREEYAVFSYMMYR